LVDDSELPPPSTSTENAKPENTADVEKDTVGDTTATSEPQGNGTTATGTTATASSNPTSSTDALETKDELQEMETKEKSQSKNEETVSPTETVSPKKKPQHKKRRKLVKAQNLRHKNQSWIVNRLKRLRKPRKKEASSKWIKHRISGTSFSVYNEIFQ